MYVVVLITILASLIEGAIWAVAYMGLNSFQTFEEALYFSLVTYSTLGYGDVILNEGDRLLSAFEATNGVIMLGWSTAIVLAAFQKLFIFKTK